MDQQRFDIWLRAFESNSEEPAPAAMSRLFGIPPEVAERLLGALPRVVRREAPVLQAQRIVAALESIGGHAEMVACPLQPARVVIVGSAPEQERARPREEQDELEDKGELRSSGTLKLGTQELAAFGLKGWGVGHADTVVEPPRPREVTVREVEAPASVPAPAPSAAMAWQSLAIAPNPVLAAPASRTAPVIDPHPPAARTAPLSAPPPALAHAAPGFAQRAELELAPLGLPAQQRLEAALELAPIAHAPRALDRSPIEHNSLRAPALPSDEPSSGSSFVVTRDLRAWMDAGSPAAAAPPIAAANAVLEEERLSLVPLTGANKLDLDLDIKAPPQARLLTALPAEDALPPVAETLRRPSARSVEARRAPAPSVAPAAPKLEAKRVLESVRAPLKLAKRAHADDWRTALSGHPQLGFALVLGATTLVFWLVEAGLR